MRKLVILLGSVALFAHCPDDASGREAKVRCTYDSVAMMQLDFDTFDQSDSLGWRKVSANPECQAEAADLIHDYAANHKQQLTEQWWLSFTLNWHEAQLRANAGQSRRAIRLMRKSIKPSVGPDRSQTWTDYTNAWNAYVRASIAFLQNKPDILRQEREALAALPVPAEFSKLEISEADRAAGNIPVWPMNLDVVDGLIACFGRPYEEAYSSSECRAAGQPQDELNK